jgi:hypothetical protein
MMRSAIYPLMVILVVVLGGCTGMRYIKSTDPLYIGSEIKFTDPNGEKKKLTAVANAVVRPEPNHKSLYGCALH